MVKQLLFVIAFLFFTNAVYGCSIVKLPAIDDPAQQAFLRGKPLYTEEASRPTYYIFIGEVVGIVKAAKAEVGESMSDAEGVKVKVTDNIYTPQSVIYYEVFPLYLQSDCSLRGATGIEQSFPIGSQVRVIANEANIYKKQFIKDAVTRLETSYLQDTTIVRNDLGEFRTTANSVFDYSSFVLKKPTTDKEWEIYDSQLSLMEFELQKDEVRLALSTSTTYRLKILKRLADYPYIYDLSYRTLLHTYLKPGQELETLEKKWLERLQKKPKIIIK